jgi:hypothetical protein
MKVKTDEVPKIIPLSKWAGTILSSGYAVFLEIYSIVFLPLQDLEFRRNDLSIVAIPEADESSLQCYSQFSRYQYKDMFILSKKTTTITSVVDKVI